MAKEKKVVKQIRTVTVSTLNAVDGYIQNRNNHNNNNNQNRPKIAPPPRPRCPPSRPPPPSINPAQTCPLPSAPPPKPTDPESRISALESELRLMSEQHESQLAALEENYRREKTRLQDVYSGRRDQKLQELRHLKNDQESKTCPLCLVDFVESREIFSCVNCGNSVCGRCKSRLNACPFCRRELGGDNPMTRNRLAENLLFIE